MARGASRIGDIAVNVGVDSPTASKYLHVLRELRLVDREVPITDPDPLRSRKGRYRISDRFLAFHFRFLQPHLSLVHAGRGERVLSEFVRPQMDALFDDGRNGSSSLTPSRGGSSTVISTSTPTTGCAPWFALKHNCTFCAFSVYMCSININSIRIIKNSSTCPPRTVHTARTFFDAFASCGASIFFINSGHFSNSATTSSFQSFHL